MEPALSASYMALADAFCYPVPGRLETLKDGLAGMPEGAGRDAFAGFVNNAARLSLGEWEELHTRSLDLNPPAAPYIGYQMWGDSYQRGTFLAAMNRALAAGGVDTGGELPDHLAPVLRYLAVTPEPLPEMVDVLGPALGRMLAALREAEPESPYVGLLLAVQAFCQGLKQEDA